MDELVERLFREFERGFDESQKNKANMVRDNVRDGIRAVLAELANVDVGEVLPSVDAVARVSWAAAYGDDDFDQTVARSSDATPEEMPSCLSEQRAEAKAALDLIASHVTPVIVALREQVATLEAQNASLTRDLMNGTSKALADQLAPMVGPCVVDIYNQAKAIAHASMMQSYVGPEVTNEAATAEKDEPIADHAARAEKVAELLRGIGIWAWGGRSFLDAQAWITFPIRDDDDDEPTWRNELANEARYVTMGPRAIAAEIQREEAKRANEWAKKR